MEYITSASNFLADNSYLAKRCQLAQNMYIQMQESVIAQGKSRRDLPLPKNRLTEKCHF